MAKRNPPCGGGGGGTPSGVVHFRVLRASPVIGMNATACDWVDAEVESISCDYPGISVGDEITVYDFSGCIFRLPIDLLTGMRGRADIMANPFTEYDIAAGTDCLYQLTAGACLWVVSNTTCCVEEIEIN